MKLILLGSIDSMLPRGLFPSKSNTLANTACSVREGYVIYRSHSISMFNDKQQLVLLVHQYCFVQ